MASRRFETTPASRGKKVAANPSHKRIGIPPLRARGRVVVKYWSGVASFLGTNAAKQMQRDQEPQPQHSTLFSTAHGAVLGLGKGRRSITKRRRLELRSWRPCFCERRTRLQWSRQGKSPLIRLVGQDPDAGTVEPLSVLAILLEVL